RARLGRYLPKLYHEQSDLVVVVICGDYVRKEWCGLEWDAIFDLLKQRRESEVMLSRFDHAIVDGLFDAGFSELDQKTPEQFATLILERLALNEGKPKDLPLPPKKPTLSKKVIAFLAIAAVLGIAGLIYIGTRPQPSPIAAVTPSPPVAAPTVK